MQCNNNKVLHLYKYIDLLGRAFNLFYNTIFKNYCIMKKLDVKLTVLPNIIAFFGLLCATDLHNFLAVAYCVVIFAFVTLQHLFDCYRLNEKTKTVITSTNVALFLIALFCRNWLLACLTLFIVVYNLILVGYIDKSNN